ncbi:hypothetical protein C0Q70_18927 [Pomacea canaliculata]|uniref:Uncharacterized protein n=1 Tax=Pomacea canaliculata TaxID=400727 RepID=A0A2T7NHY5_POMCA|nr:hypothetical protein C0Q70_18927 [Pomacea canaliculata]
MKWVLILCACAVVSSAMNFPSLKLLLEKEKELLDNPEEVRELLERLSGGRHVGKRLFLSLDSLKSAFDTVVDGVKSAAHTVAGGVETAVHKVEEVAQSALHGVEDAAHVVAEKVEGAAQDVAHFVSGAAHDVSHFFSSAAEKLAPLLDSIAKVAGPIAQQIGEVALQVLTVGDGGCVVHEQLLLHELEPRPGAVVHLGEAAVQAAIAAAGKRDVNILLSFLFDVESLGSEHLAGIFSNAVQTEVKQDETEGDAELSAATHEKRFLLDNLLGLIHIGEQQLSNLLGSLEALASTSSSRPWTNVRTIAQTVRPCVHIIDCHCHSLNMSLPLTQHVLPPSEQLRLGDRCSGATSVRVLSPYQEQLGACISRSSPWLVVWAAGLEDPIFTCAHHLMQHVCAEC